MRWYTMRGPLRLNSTGKENRPVGVECWGSLVSNILRNGPGGIKADRE